MKIQNSFELLEFLKKSGYQANTKDPLWWPNSGSFKVIVGAILTQQTKWEHVELSLKNLEKNNLLNLQNLAFCNIELLQNLIQPSGFYRKKAYNLKHLSQNIINEFENFENFSLHVKREWLLRQKGVGFESADAMLCYGCKREIMVVDSYTNRLLRHFGYEFENYNEIQEWLVNGLYENENKIIKLYKKKIQMNEVFARFHGKIVLFCKENMRGNKVAIKVSEL